MLSWAIRPFVNLALTKNTTDVALAVDAMELACQTPTPSVIAIGSGDADFVPLVVRLRERGIRVICVSERTKMASEAVHAYDSILFVGKDAVALGAGVTKSNEEAKRPTAKKPTVKITKAGSSGVAVAKKVPAKKAVAPAKSAQKAEVTLDQILTAAPSLRTGQKQPLGDIVNDLHHAKLIGKNAVSTKLFKKFLTSFELTPEHQPNHVRYLAR
jgi:hypothetical protein